MVQKNCIIMNKKEKAYNIKQEVLSNIIAKRSNTYKLV